MRSYKLELRQITVQLLIFFVALKFALLELFQNLKSKFHRRNILRHDQKWTAPLRRSRRIHTRKIALLRKIRKLWHYQRSNANTAKKFNRSFNPFKMNFVDHKIDGNEIILGGRSSEDGKC